MKTIILIHPAIDFKDHYPCSWIPFSVLSIGSVIPSLQFHVLIFDENCITKKEIYDTIQGEDVFLVGFSIMTGGGQIANAMEIARNIRKMFPNVFCVFGGPHVNVLPEQTVQCEEVDYAICGPGQNSFPLLANALLNHEVPDGIPGLYYCINGKVVRPQNIQAYINKLTPYNFNLINPENYIKYDATIAERTLNYIASQGCPYGCSFCYEYVYDRKYHQMALEFVCRDMELYAKEFGVTGIKFYDADFFINLEFCKTVIRTLQELDLSWAASIHPRDILNHQKGSHNHLLDIIKKSRCTRLLMGMESGSNRILHDVINKRVDVEDYRLIAQTIAEYGLLGSYTFMVGFPGETPKEIEQTFTLIHSLWDLNIPIETKVHIYLPYPGTPLYDQAIKLGFKAPKKLADWSNFNYYKSMTPWTDLSLEKRVAEYTRMVDKNKKDDEL